jgi:tRNA dimethylallyltransferase
VPPSPTSSHRHRHPVLVGGTGLYLRAVIDELDIPGRFPDVAAELAAELDTVALHRRLAELDPLAASRMEPANRRRVLRALEVTIGSGRPVLVVRARAGGVPTQQGRSWSGSAGLPPRSTTGSRPATTHQLDAGFLDEVQRLLDEPRGWSPTASQALGYKELAAHLRGECTLDEALDLALRRTRRFARRQERWFRRDPRIHWIDVGPDLAHTVEVVLGILDGAQSGGGDPR